MLTKVEIRPVTGSPLELNTTDGSGNHLYPLTAFEIITNIDNPGESRKMGAPGQWQMFHYPDAMIIHGEGTIYGVGASDAARATDYITKRLAFLDAVLPPPTTIQTVRYHAVLRVRFDGMSEEAETKVVCTQQSVPMAALYPANSRFMITWKSFEPYFTGVSTPSNIYQLG